MADGEVFPDDLVPNEHGLVALGGVLTTDLVCEAYQKGIFPWTGRNPIPWYSPDPRCVLFPAELHISRSLAKVVRQDKFEVRVDAAFEEVMRRCASIRRRGDPGTWITPNMLEVYGQLHTMGVAHSVEAYADDELCGGLYGLTFGRIFFGESMFAARANASKVALHALCRRLADLDFELIDCQQKTDHLTSLGAVTVSRAEFLDRLRRALGHRSLHTRWR